MWPFKKHKEKVKEERLFDVLGMAIITGSSDAAVSIQESMGQQTLVGNEELPTDISEEDKKVLLKAGVKFLGVLKSDPLFQYVTLPEGWKKVKTGHSMWSDLIDGRGRKRASIFYKAASYDRSAHLQTNRRYRFEYDYTKLDDSIAMITVKDGEEVIFTTERLTFDDTHECRLEAKRLVQKSAENWLDEHFPLWKDNSAYWD